jgi:hypothetical protein
MIGTPALSCVRMSTETTFHPVNAMITSGDFLQTATAANLVLESNLCYSHVLLLSSPGHTSRRLCSSEFLVDIYGVRCWHALPRPQERVSRPS